MADNPHQILVAEDHLVNQKVAKLLVNALGLDCKIVENGQQAVLAAIEADRPGAILMDIMMPELDGFEATQAIRRSEFACRRKHLIDHSPTVSSLPE